MRPGERAVIAVAGIGVIGWLVAGEPLVGTACVVAADLLGVAMMIPKIYREPGSETLATFALAGLAGAAAAGAVGRADLSLLLYRSTTCWPTGRSPCSSAFAVQAGLAASTQHDDAASCRVVS